MRRQPVPRVAVDRLAGDGRRALVVAVSEAGGSRPSAPVTLRVPPGAEAPPLYDVYALVAKPDGHLLLERHAVAAEADAIGLVDELARRADVWLAQGGRKRPVPPPEGR
ncbi:MAG: hypothetical protein M3P85_08550 [Actinomycetota bacterium]|nr:hypothetical protein [Actinomycetota bacterium]